MLTHRNILMNAWYVTGCQKISEGDRMCVPVPFYHCFGCVMGALGAVTRGAAMIVPAEYFNPTTTLDIMERERCTTIYGVPTMFVAMLEDASLKHRDLSSLRSGVMAGSPCPIEVMKKVLGDMGWMERKVSTNLQRWMGWFHQSSGADRPPSARLCRRSNRQRSCQRRCGAWRLLGDRPSGEVD
jgi:fatty-acyl-CoA synthase